MEQKTEAKNRKGIDWRWLGIGFALIVVLIVAIVANSRGDGGIDEKIASTITTDNGDLKINWDKYPTNDIELSESLTISKSGTYHLTGSLDGGSVTINARSAVVRLILDNVDIKSASGPAIACLECEDLVIELVGDSRVEDSGDYSDFTEDDGGVIYSKSDLTFGGEGGFLTVVSNYEDAIVGKDDLKFNGGAYIISAIDDGIRGTDSVYIVNGSFNVTSGTDAIKTTNDLDAKKGFILIENGEFNITAGGKGIEATNSILFQDGNLVIDAYDDAIHSDDYIGIVNGVFMISAGDDGIHSDMELIVDNGDINVMKSYEGFEAQAVTINGGAIRISSNDDGINAGGGADSSADNNPRNMRGDAFKADLDCVLTINGGDIYVNAAGDGLDSNGYIYFNDGNVVVDGPTNNGNGALDSGAGIKMQGGTVVAVGASGMAETLGANSGVPNISVYFDTTNPAGTEVTVKDSSGNVVIRHTSAKTFNHMAAGGGLALGETYSIHVDGKLYEQFTITEVTTVIGNANANQFNMPGRGPGM